MRIIDLLNMISKGEEVPKRIKYFGLVYEHCDRCKQYEHNDVGVNIKLFEEIVDLTDTVEILDDEEKGLPEKLDIEQDSPTSNYYIRNEYGTKCGLTKHSKIIADKLNDLIDYLEKQSKGE